MVRKVSLLALAFAIMLTFGSISQANAASVYDGNFSTTYLTFMKDIVSGIGFKDDYVAFRSGQYDYTLVVGDLDYNGTFKNNGTCKEYVFSSDGGYNSYYVYNVNTISSFSLDAEDKIIYSNLGEYPQLVSRGDNYEMLQTLLISIGLLGIVINAFFTSRRR